MNYSQFISAVKLYEKTELEKVQLSFLFLDSTEDAKTFSINVVIQLLKDIGHPISNVSRIKNKLTKSKDFKKCGKENEYMLTPAAKTKLYSQYGNILENNEDIVSSSEILDETLFLGKRGYLDKLIKQINSCYSNNCYDACAVLMRRFFEISLILTYEKHNIQASILDVNGDYVMLERIVSDAIHNKTLHLSRSRKEYDAIRNLGNFSAHKIHFNAKKSDIDDLRQIYRVCIEELFYKSGLCV
jgi:hypothetical protein